MYKRQTLIAKALAKSRESRVLISAELKHKADCEMKHMISVLKPLESIKNDTCSNGDDVDHKLVRRSGNFKRNDEAVLEKTYNKGLQLRNGRSLPESDDFEKEKSVLHSVWRQSNGSECGAKVKKSHVQYRSRSLSPVRPLALSRPRRSANAKRSVCYLRISWLHVAML